MEEYANDIRPLPPSIPLPRSLSPDPTPDAVPGAVPGAAVPDAALGRVRPSIHSTLVLPIPYREFQ